METIPRLELHLYAWGANSYGQLGQGHLEDLSVPECTDISGVQNGALRLLSGGGGHTVVVTDHGELLVCGQNNRGQLGLGHTSDVPTLQCCPSLSHKVELVSCGWDYTLLLTDSGQALACGSNAFGQLGVVQPVTHSSQFLVIEGLKESVISVGAGLRHSLAVTDTGTVYQWGKGLLSQAKRALHPHRVPSHLSSTVPCRVPGFHGVTVTKVAAGSFHCAGLTEAGDLFLWGSNKYGQITTSEPFLSLPTPLQRKALGGERVKHVWSGWTHLVAKTESERVFTWGRQTYGQLGRPTATSQATEPSSAGPSPEGDSQGSRLPAEVTALRGASQIACGSEHNLAIVGGCLVSWGWNEHGMCGDGSQMDVVQPQPITGLQSFLIGCGAGHSMALCVERTRSEQNSESTPTAQEHQSVHSSLTST